jgi:hypothetical protein
MEMASVSGFLGNRNRAMATIAVLAAALSTIPIFASVIPAMTDVSSHVLVARILNEYDNRTLGFAEHFVVDWKMAPTALFYLVLEQLQTLTGPYTDARIFLVAWTLGLALATWALARVSGNEHPWLSAILAAPLGFSWFVWMGFLPYIATFPIFAATVAAWIGIRHPVARILVAWLMLALLFGFHVVGMCAAMAAIGGLTLARQIRGAATFTDWLQAGLAILPCFLLLALYLGGSDSPAAAIQYRSALDQLIGLFRYTLASLTRTGSYLLAAWGLAVLAGASVMAIARRQLPDTVAVAVMLLAIGLVVPTDLGALWPAGPRLFPYALLLLVSALHFPNRLALPVALAGLAWVAAMTYVTTDRVRKIDRDYREYQAAVASIRPGSRILPVFSGVADGPDLTWPYMALVSFATIQHGGVNPYVFAKPYIFTNATPLSYRQELGREARILFDPEKDPATLASSSAAYDFLLLWRPSTRIIDSITPALCKSYQSANVTVLQRESETCHAQSIAISSGVH